MAHVYFDHNATSPVAPEVLREMTEVLGHLYGNASSIHYYGQEARRRLEGARRNLAARLGCEAKEIVFTSGGTEADNLAIWGTLGVAPAGAHAISTTIEHPAVLQTLREAEARGAAVTWIGPGPDGRVDADEIRRAVRPETKLISVMHANNETGVLQPIAEIGAGVDAEVTLHTDAVQSTGRMEFGVKELGVNLLSLSGHKFGAPKGVGALYVRSGTKLGPQMFGGRHERERRAGTENVPGAAALGVAAGLAVEAWTDLAELRDHLERSVLNRVPGVVVNGGTAPRLANTSNLQFEGVEGEAMVIALDLRGFAISSGSACSSGAVEPSHVLLAMGLTREQARSSVRISLGPGNTRAEVNDLVEAIVESAAHLRRISPQMVAHA